MQTHLRRSLMGYLNELPDPRVQARCDYDLVDVLAIALCAPLCGAQSFDDMADQHLSSQAPGPLLRSP
jgi:hypothetical protein